jgi:hypothetical protein
LLASAIDLARDNRDLAIGSNVDFKVIATFEQETPEGNKLLRGIYYDDCRVVGSGITTYYDKEEPFATVGGFAVNQAIDFDCAGMTPLNPKYDENMKSNEQHRDYLMASGIHAISEFRFHDNTIETIDFPIFKQHQILSKSNPTFQLTGMIGDYPSLYKQVDDTINNGNTFGVSLSDELFDVNVNLQQGEKTVRGFSYSDCRITDYSVDTQKGNEEGFFFWFALDNTFEFECSGYTPKNPSYDTISDPVEKKSTSTLDLRDTQTWGYKFKYIPKE